MTRDITQAVRDNEQAGAAMMIDNDAYLRDFMMTLSVNGVSFGGRATGDV